MNADRIAQDVMQTLGGAQTTAMTGGTPVKMMNSDNVTGMEQKEHGIVANARSRSLEASQPNAGKVVATEGGK